MTGLAIDLDRVRFDYEDMAMEFTAAIPAGSFTAVIGPSGAGKSTLLNLIAGFEAPLSGRVAIGGADMVGVDPARRPLSMVFQDNNLFAHLDVAANVGLGIAPSLKLSPDERDRVAAAIDRVGLAGFETRRPGQMSGGERQRVAIARTLVRDRPVLLLDEPFAALGPALRRDMLDLIADIHRTRHPTVVLVTHDPDDARHAATHTAFLDAGRIAALMETEALFAATGIPGLAAYLGA